MVTHHSTQAAESKFPSEVLGLDLKLFSKAQIKRGLGSAVPEKV
jgi:hypothetical protein